MKHRSVMLKKDIKDLISYHVRYYGQGYKYDCQINGKRVHGITELKSRVEEGDEVQIHVYQGHQGFWRGHEIERIRFVIKDDQISRYHIEKYRKRHKGTNVWSCPSDYQRKKLYRWERDVIKGWHDKENNYVSDVEQANQYVEDVFDLYDLRPAKVKFHAGRTKSCSYFGGGFGQLHEIRIGDWGFSKNVLIHESAHGYVYIMGYKGFVSSHGPLFTSIYIHLLSEFLGYDEAELIESAKEYGLDVIEDIDMEELIERGNNDEDLTLKDLNYLRQENYALKDGTKLTNNQLVTLKEIQSGSNDVDGRSAKALVRRGIISKKGNNYKLTTRGENAVKALN